MKLTTEQHKPIQAKSEHRLILAGPGTGKSTTILGYISYLIRDLGVNPRSILLITFTRAATNELRIKIKKQLGEGAELPKIYTLHGFSLRQLMRNAKKIVSLPVGFKIANDYEERYIITEDLKVLIGAKSIKEVQTLLNQLSTDWETLEADSKTPTSKIANPKFIGAWQEHRAVYGYLLRSELVYQFKKALEQEADIKIDGPIEHLIVDEYQDLNKCDLAVIEHLRAYGMHTFCAGDDDQSIYGFRYAHPEGIRNFEKEVPGSENFILTECFRCDKAILELSQLLIDQDHRRIRKELRSMTGKDGEVHLLRFATQYHEARKVAEIAQDLITNKHLAPSEIIILLRSDHNKCFSEILISELNRLSVPNRRANESLAILRDNNGRYLLALLKYFKHPKDDLALRTILELTKGLGSATFLSIYEAASKRVLRFHQAIERIVSGEITDIKNLGKVQSALKQLSALQGQIHEELSIQNAIEIIKDFIPGYNTDFRANLDIIINEHKIENVSGLIDYTDELLSPEIEAPSEDLTEVRIMSMHQAKGLSAKAVFIVAAEDEYLPGKGNIDEERRLLYVSTSRAISYLFISYCHNRIYAQQHTGSLKSPTTLRHLTRYLRDLPTIKVEDGGSFSTS